MSRGTAARGFFEGASRRSAACFGRQRGLPRHENAAETASDGASTLKSR
jgi:hypothetical protein